MNATNGRYFVGAGCFNWNRMERVGDRYGVVKLFVSKDSEKTVELRSPPVVRGHLEAVVIAARDSGHIGDLFHGVFPVTPEVGEVIRLGEPGTLVMEDDEYGNQIGVRPDDGRETQWLDICALYRAHDQDVHLFAVADQP